MSVEVIVAGGFVGIVVLVLAVSGYLAFRSGASSEKIDRAEDEAKDATEQVKRRTDPVLSDREYVERLRRAEERLARLRNRTSK